MGCAIETAVGIENQTALRIAAIAIAAEGVQNGFRSVRRDLVDRAASTVTCDRATRAVTTECRRTVEAAIRTHDRRGPGLRAVRAALESVHDLQRACMSEGAGD